MEQEHHNSRCLPQYSTSHRRLAMKEIGREQSLVTKLRAIVLPALQADERSELVAQMFQNILDSSSKAMAELQILQSQNALPDDVVLVDDKKRVKRNSSSGDCTKRRRFDKSVSIETPVPHYDGRQWRKYGQKHINNSKHPRSYYRCTYRQEQDCKATKTVQQQDDSSGAGHTLMYMVVYYGQHTCTGNDGVNNSGPNDSKINTPSSSNSQSSISSTCTDPYNHQASLHDNKLIDKSEDLVTLNMYESFDMTAFAPLDLDSWGLDALLRFGA